TGELDRPSRSACARRIGLRRFSVSTASHSAAAASGKPRPLGWRPPAQLTSTSTSAPAAATSASAPPFVARSAVTGVPRSGAAPRPAAAASTSATSTCIPAAARTPAIASPSPPPAPVTTARRPESSIAATLFAHVRYDRVYLLSEAKRNAVVELDEV